MAPAISHELSLLTSVCRFAWTSFRHVYWLVPVIASVFFGAGLYIIVLGILCYVVDVSFDPTRQTRAGLQDAY